MTTLRLKTNLNCRACVAAVKPHLDGESTIARWDVDLAAPEKTLTVHGDAISTDKVRAVVAKAGFEVKGEIAPPAPDSSSDQGPPTSYYPLFLVFAFVIGVVALVEVASGSFAWNRAMQNFMGAFFVAFSFFKLLDLRGFADSFRMYDIVAQRIPAYGFVYPFIELTLGMAYIAGIAPFTTNLVTFVVMSVGAIGVLRSLLAKRKIRCACLGAVFNLPMSSVTLVEDGLMVAMAAIMLIAGPHESISRSNDPQSHSPKGSAVMQNHNHAHGHRQHPSNASLLVHADSIQPAGRTSDLQMMIHSGDGTMLADFETTHEEKVHLIIVREGLDTFAHLHPRIESKGGMTVSYAFPIEGTYRLFADVQPVGGEPTTASTTIRVHGDSIIAADLTPNVPGRILADGISAEITIERVGDGIDAVIGFELVDSDGRSIPDLKRYLGAWGHLVMISKNGREFIHAHPLEAGADAPEVVTFHSRFPAGGLYKGWGQFQLGDGVHMVPFVVKVP